MQNIQGQAKLYLFQQPDKWVPIGRVILQITESVKEMGYEFKLYVRDVNLDTKMYGLRQIIQGYEYQILVDQIVTYESLQQKIIACETKNKSIYSLSFQKNQLKRQFLKCLKESKSFSSYRQNLNDSIDSQLIQIVQQLQDLREEDQEQNYQIFTEQRLIQIKYQVDRLKEEPNRKIQQKLFLTIKKYLLAGPSMAIYLLVSKQYFPVTLQCLSMNFQFGDRRIDYLTAYLQNYQNENVLQIDDAQILQQYECIGRNRFLVNVAASMFIQPYAESLLNFKNIQNSTNILGYLSKNTKYLQKLKKIAKEQPSIFIKVFSEIGDMFRTVIINKQTLYIKQQFYKILWEDKILDHAIHAIILLTKIKNHNQNLYQLFFQQLNPFLTHNWDDSQQKLVDMFYQNKYHLGQAIIQILNCCNFHIKGIILTFIQNLINKSDLRQNMTQRLFNYVYNEIISKISIFFTTTYQLEIYCDFFLKIYNFDTIRTRRILIQSDFLKILEQKMNNKYILLLVIKLLKSFLKQTDPGIFIYIKRNKLFFTLRQQYFKIKKYNSQGILRAAFLQLITVAIPNGKSNEGVLIISSLFDKPQNQQ